jgi:Flp pilus assembly protein CpaB
VRQTTVPDDVRLSGGAGGQPQLRVANQSSLPTGRAVAGGFFVAVAAVLVVSAWLATRPTAGQPWVVTTRALATGTRLGSADLTTVRMRLAAPTNMRAFHDAAALVGRVLSGPLDGGELVQAASLVPAGQNPSRRPVTVAVDDTDARGLAPGMLVDVLETTGTGSTATTSVVVLGAEVIDTAASSSGLVGSSGGATVTLGVTTLAEVEAVVQAAHSGTVTVVVAEPSDGRGQGTAGSGGPASGGSGSSSGTSSSTGTASP